MNRVKAVQASTSWFTYVSEMHTPRIHYLHGNKKIVKDILKFMYRDMYLGRAL